MTSSRTVRDHCCPCGSSITRKPRNTTSLHSPSIPDTTICSLPPLALVRKPFIFKLLFFLINLFYFILFNLNDTTTHTHTLALERVDFQVLGKILSEEFDPLHSIFNLPTPPPDAMCFLQVSFDHQLSTGGVCLFSLKNPSYPEWICHTTSPVMCLDFNERQPHLLVIGNSRVYTIYF